MKTPDTQAALTWWFTGLPGSGKTTLATAWAEHLRAQQRPAVLLDGDELHPGLSSDLGLSQADCFATNNR